MEPVESLWVAEIETDAPEPVVEKAPTPGPPVANEYASPVFMKRSRASYGPLFELFDEELEDDGGRRGKGRKRPRYSVERGRWRYREDSSSPEPEASLEAAPIAEQSNGNATTQSAPSKPEMTDGGCQTNDFELPPPPPSSSFNTPLKSWRDAEKSPLFAMGMARSTGAPGMDIGVQASPSIPNLPLPDEQHEAALVPDTRSTLGIAASYPDLFGTPQRPDHSFGNAESSLATVQTPTQSVFSQPTHGGTAFGTGSSPSVGFKFGQPPPQSTSDAPPFIQSQAPDQPYDHHPYPESYLADDEPTNLAPTIPHNPFTTEARPHPYNQPGFDKTSELDVQESRTSPYWTTAASADPIQRPEHLDPVDDGRSDESIREEAPPGTIPSHVEDGTRNQDEMKHEGLLSRPVYRQGVPEEALPDHGYASAGDEDDSMGSDDQADYDEEEKGDDYDLRNYDRVSDDEEGYDNEQEPLTDEELLDEDEEQYEDEEEDYDEDDYEEDDFDGPNHHAQASRFSAQQPPQPTPSKGPQEPVVIDLLSDSDDDEPPASQPPRPQFQQPPPANVVKSVPAKDTANQLAPKSQPLAESEPEHETSEDEQESESEEDAVADELDEQVAESDLEGEFDEDDEVSEEDIEAPENMTGEPDNDDVVKDIVSCGGTRVTMNTTPTIADEYRVVSSSPEKNPQSNEGNEGVNADEGHTVQPKSHVTEEHTVVEEQHESVVESFQTQPAEMLSSFQTQTSEAAQGLETGPEVVEECVDEDAVRSDKLQGDAIRMDEDQEKLVPEEGMQEDAQEDGMSEEDTRQNMTVKTDFQAEVADKGQDLGRTDVIATKGSVDDTTIQQAEKMELDPEVSEDELLDPENARSAEGQTSPDKFLTDSLNEEQHVPPHTSTHDESHILAKVDASMTTTTTSHVETRSSNTQQITFETQETELVFSQPATAEEDLEDVSEEKDTEMAGASPSLEGKVDAEETRDATPLHEKDVEMADVEVPSEGEDSAEEHYEAPPLSNKDDVVDVVASPRTKDNTKDFDDVPPALSGDKEESKSQDAGVKDVGSEEISSKEDGIKGDSHNTKSTPSSPQQMGTQDHRVDQNPEPASTQTDGAHSDEGEEFHDVSEIPEAESFSPIIPYDENSSFMTANSEYSEMQESEGTEHTPMTKRKRAGRKSRNDLSINFKRTPRPSSSELSPGSQRTTRSKAMAFHKILSPKDDKEDMSIQLARAAMKSPTKRKASAKSVSRLKTNLIKRLADEMPECVPLKDLKKYNNRTLDVAVVAASALTPPKRTPVREYVSSLTVTDPSLASESVIEVTIFSLHRDHFPVVRPGDSILLRSFTVKSLPDKGWGLKSDKNISSWAVFEADGGDTPQMRAAPVELDDNEQKYLVDLRGWYAALDDGAKDKLGKAVGEMIDKGREQRREK